MPSKLLALIALLLPLAVIGCGVGVSAYTPPAQPAQPGAVNQGVRGDCNAILNTAFRSAQERDWYNTFCSHWPETNYGGPVPAAAPSPAPTACDAMKGKPSGNEDARNWYNQNCGGQALPGPETGQNAALSPNDVPAPPGSAAAQVADRHDCSAIRGTAYNSPTERTWFLANCTAPVNTAVVQPTPVAQAQLVYPTGQLPTQAYMIQPGTLCGLPLGAVDLSLQALHKQICGN